jgi:23S rRNA (cytidine1920-2'-O)/16S rRNA (cytidine1409-2'-O)-methyltransferase
MARATRVRSPGSGRGKAGYERLDTLLVRRGLAPSRERARALILARGVLVDGQIVEKAGTLVPLDAHCERAGTPAELRYVSRGGLKLERALDAFALDPAGRACLDVGASTGGFTDVLLRRGAARVYAMDVGHGQLAWSLRTDSRVVVMERTNIRWVTALPEPMGCAMIDVSFISLRLVLEPVARLLGDGAWVVALVKPQFEAGRAEADRGAGVISDPAVHRRVLHDLLAWLTEWRARVGKALVPRGLIASPVAGRDGNREYLMWLGQEESTVHPSLARDAGVESVVEAAFAAVRP